jgi:hypothetical protein
MPAPPPPVNQIVQTASAHSPVQSSHACKRLKTKSHHAPDKGKAVSSPSSPSNDSAKSVSSHMHLRDDFSHVISEIGPKGSTQPKENSEKSKGKLPPKVANMVFECFYLLIFENCLPEWQIFIDFWICWILYFLDMLDIIFFEYGFKYH